MPAPAPMIGCPAATWARSRSSASLRVIARSLISSWSRSAIARAKSGSLTSRSSSCTSTFGVERLAERREERRVGLGVVERPGPRSRSPRRRAAARRAPSGPSAAVSFAADPAPELAALLGRRAHQRDRSGCGRRGSGPANRCGHGVARAEVDHVERAERDDLRQPALPGRLEPLGARREHAADELVGQLGRRHVERRRRGSPPRASASIDWPPAPVAWKTSTS